MKSKLGRRRQVFSDFRLPDEWNFTCIDFFHHTHAHLQVHGRRRDTIITLINASCFCFRIPIDGCDTRRYVTKTTTTKTRAFSRHTLAIVRTIYVRLCPFAKLVFRIDSPTIRFTRTTYNYRNTVVSSKTAGRVAITKRTAKRICSGSSVDYQACAADAGVVSIFASSNYETFGVF